MATLAPNPRPRDSVVNAGLDTGSRTGNTTLHIALAGNPNAGKTTLFNALTGMRQKVGNYPGVTVEKKEGRFSLSSTREAVVLDLPGTYSLAPKSPDEEIARDVLLGLREDTPVPDVVIIVVDASNLERNLYLATQVLELRIPCIVALNMSDVAQANGKPIDAKALGRALGAPVVPLVAVRKEGLDELREVLLQTIERPTFPLVSLPADIEVGRENLAAEIGSQSTLETDWQADQARAMALRLLAGAPTHAAIQNRFGVEVAQALVQLHADPRFAPASIGVAEAQARYAQIGNLASRVVSNATREISQSLSDRLDAVLTHKVWGLAIFALITLMVFQSIYSWASLPMDFIEGATNALGDWVAALLPDGPLQDLMVHGVIAGVGAVIIFIPQILILFFFIGLLEDTGYMARAAFLMDRLMARVGLHGRAFIPLLSSFACAIPGIMATRTIASRRDRMTTILIAPLMACSARLPVYTLMIGNFIPDTRVLGFVSLRALTLFNLYLLGVVVAMAMATLFKKTLFKGPPPPLMLELPPYKIPAWRNIVVTMWERGSQFLQRAGTVILAISIVLWFLLSYPKINSSQVRVAPISPAAGVEPGPGHAPKIVQQPSAQTRPTDDGLAAAQLRHSFAGQIGHVIEPLIAPLGFNWKIGIGLIGAMSAREVFVSTMGTVYSVANADETSQPLHVALKRDRWPDGRKVWTPLVAVSLMVYFVLAMQCMSTLAVVKRETNSWKWPLFMQVYLTVLAWSAAFIVYQGGRWLGWG